MNNSTRGSEWRKWDLHVHTSNSYDWDSACKDDLNSIIDKSLNEGLSAIAITDHHSVASIDRAVEYGRSKGLFVIPGVELRTDKGNKKIHIIGLFDPTIKAKTIYDKVLCPLGFSEDDIKNHSNEQIYCSFEKACNTIHDLGGLVMLHAGNKSNGIEQLDSDLKSLLKTDLAKQVDIFEVSTAKQENDYKNIVFPKIDRFLPCVITSDSVERKKYKKGHSTESIGAKCCFIKANCTFEGLKQILYEPRPGERVCLEAILPDEKDSYRVIDKIVFESNEDFPEEVNFNKNLSSIIGSRSSGKSALLTYIADSIDSSNTRKMRSGPGDGIAWKDIKLNYHIKWANGKTNKESPGSIVFIPQNFLFNISKNPEEIKSRIEPVLFKIDPEFKEKYNRFESQIISDNNQISVLVDEWFLLMGNIDKANETLIGLGNKKSVELLIKTIKNEIDSSKKRYSLDKNELEKYQTITSQISDIIEQTEILVNNKNRLTDVTDNYFSSIDITMTPSYDNLPTQLKNNIDKYIEGAKPSLMKDVNRLTKAYKKEIEKNITDLEAKLKKVNEENVGLINKYQKMSAVQKLVDQLNAQSEILKQILATEKNIIDLKEKVLGCEEKIDKIISGRKEQLSELSKALRQKKPKNMDDIEFGIEQGIDNQKMQSVTNKINTKENTDFVKNNYFDITKAQNESKEFLVAVYSDKQNINSHNSARDVCKEVFQYTEKILFCGEMEGDKIGGFSESTMTPGKRALFALRLILTESEGSWPLLIDQPEDDLDSRSIFNEIVPFIMEKKKLRQIILVSHNANMVIGSDSEQIIVANKNGTDRRNEDGKQFNYLTGGLESTKIRDEKCNDTLNSQGIREHACDILDGGKTAFENRINKYCIQRDL